MANRLADSTSPYLLQHADNPVDWWEWGAEAFDEAHRRDAPVLLSVGYASCHWCHVMAHESFEDEATAELMNQWFVNIKVDREERPDVDRIYMDAVQVMTGRGGWPMTVFLTPDAEPFYAGTYFPNTDRHGHPSFTRVLEGVRTAWDERRDDVAAQAASLAASVAVSPPSGDGMPDESVLRAAYAGIRSQFDPEFGGFGGAPKFPQAPTLEFLMRAAGRDWAPDAASMLSSTLTRMADGGIHDQVGGGFSRYSVDRAWLVPHFEKMLYDNASLARLYLRAWQVTGEDRFASVARSTLDYMRRDLELPGGGFASGEDADSEGEEGTFYVFTHEEIDARADSPAVLEVLGATPGGNFEGRTIVHRSRAVDEVASEYGIDTRVLADAVDRTLVSLAELRAERVRPGLDDKAVCAWNGLAIRAYAEAGAVLGDAGYIEAATRTAEFVLEHMRRADGRLMRTWRDGRVSVPAFCDDYAAAAVGLLELYQATWDARWFHAGRELVEQMIELFWDGTAGGFFATGSDAEELIARPKNLFDNPTPSDNALAAEALQMLAAFTGDGSLLERLELTVALASRLCEQYPTGAGHMLSVLLVALTGVREVAIVGDGSQRDDLVRVLRSQFRPGVFVAGGDGATDDGIPLLVGRTAPGGTTAVYVCREFVCEAPLNDPQDLTAILD